MELSSKKYYEKIKINLESFGFFPIEENSMKFYYFKDKTIIFDFQDFDIITMSFSNFLFLNFIKVGREREKKLLKNRLNNLLETKLWLP